MRDRRSTYVQVNAALSRRNDDELTTMLAESTPLGEGIGGPTYKATVAGMPVFVKRVPLTNLERAHHLSTENLFDLPTHYQYGVGSAGFGAWRELAAHVETTDWVLSGECESFPLMYHWRVLPRTGKQPDNDKWVAFWGGSEKIRKRLDAIDSASASIVLFLEFVPLTVHEWLKANPDGIEEVEAELLNAVDVMNRNGLFHFDAHFNNVMADDERLYIGDFGLATSTRYALSRTEIEFVQANESYDQALIAGMLAFTAAGLLNAEDPIEYVRQVAAGNLLAGTPSDRRSHPASNESAADRVLARHAPVAAVFHDFFEQLQSTSKETPYPADDVARALAAR